MFDEELLLERWHTERLFDDLEGMSDPEMRAEYIAELAETRTRIESVRLPRMWARPV